MKARPPVYGSSTRDIVASHALDHAHEGIPTTIQKQSIYNPNSICSWIHLSQLARKVLYLTRCCSIFIIECSILTVVFSLVVAILLKFALRPFTLSSRDHFFCTFIYKKCPTKSRHGVTCHQYFNEILMWLACISFAQPCKPTR